MKILPYAEMFPGMSDEDFAALVANRKENTLEKSIDAIEGNILNERNPFTNRIAAGITKCIFLAQDKSSVVIYSIFDAGFGPEAYTLDTLKPLIEDAGEVFVWTDEPSLKMSCEALDAAKRHGVAVTVHTTRNHTRFWRRTFARAVMAATERAKHSGKTQ